MENLPCAELPAATDEPAVPFTPRSAVALSTARVSEALVADAIEHVLDAAAEANSGRAQRRDGWTPERITTFLTALAQCGSVEHAARAAGMTRQGAYALRSRAGGRVFALAWTRRSSSSPTPASPTRSARAPSTAASSSSFATARSGASVTASTTA